MMKQAHQMGTHLVSQLSMQPHKHVHASLITLVDCASPGIQFLTACAGCGYIAGCRNGTGHIWDTSAV